MGVELIPSCEEDSGHGIGGEPTDDSPPAELRRLAASTRNANQSRRLLSLAAVLNGMNRTEAARIGGMDRQTLRDWVHRFDAHGPDGRRDWWSK